MKTPSFFAMVLTAGTFASGAVLAGPPNPQEFCGEYFGQPDVFGYCVYRHVSPGFDASQAQQWCTAAGTFDVQCRHAWVEGQLFSPHGGGLEELMQVCGNDLDCRLDVLDKRPAATLTAQLIACDRYGGRQSSDCAVHATQRWWGTSPSVDELEQVARDTTAFGDQVGFYLGAAVGCSKVMECPSNPRVNSYCLGWSREFTKNPEQCPPHNPQMGMGPQPPPPAGGRPNGGGQPGVTMPPPGYGTMPSTRRP